ncbi:restriction endonuclease subunit S [Actinocrinis puniceicyclus]|uniref:Restriction endonuclease subunit S n=1 Tax=Actinocrinis puniceicyclus TaxID=977794 RepID=A0A8J7WRT5_9ACTN|nr:restriction endonuclease subunit S [Actinocrinis puniceicyclus]MBS2966348.1 restriction endonuclease subunit S [Actinocrinis puniceicyclus]
MSEWRERELGDLCNRITVGHVGSMVAEYVPSGVKFLRSLNIRPGRLGLDGIKYISNEFHARLSKSQLFPGDLVIVRTGEPGATAIIPEGFGPANCSDVVIARPGSGVNGRFLCYAINETAHDFVRAHTVGAVQQHFNVASAKKLRIRLPSLAEQHAIAAVLGALDDKIAVNERIAATARQLASALYVDACAARSVIMSIEGFSSYLNRGQSPKYSDCDSMLVINQKCVRDGRILLGSARKTQTARVHVDRKLRFGDVLINSTGVGTLGRVGIWSHDLEATVDSHVTIVRVNPAVVQPIIGGFALLAAQPEIEAMGEGSTGQTELSRAKLGTVKVRIPDFGRNELAARLSALENSSNAVLQEVVSLTALRDTLLPKLMSGQLTVKQAESVVEDVT